MLRHARSGFVLLRATLAVVTCSALLSGPAHALPVTTEFTLSGLVNNPGTFNLSNLQVFTPVTQTVTYLAGSTTVNQDFTGVPLYNFLNNAGVNGGGGIILTPGVSNDALRDYVVVYEATDTRPSRPSEKSIPISGRPSR